MKLAEIDYEINRMYRYYKQKDADQSVRNDTKNERNNEIFYFKSIDEEKAKRLFQSLENFVYRIYTPNFEIWHYSQGVVTKTIFE